MEVLKLVSTTKLQELEYTFYDRDDGGRRLRSRLTHRVFIMSTPLLVDKCNRGDPSSPRMTLQTFKLTYPCGHKGICSLNIDQELLSETKAFQMPGLSTFCCLCWWHLRLYLNVRLFSEMSDCFWSVRLLSEVSSSVFQHGHSCTPIC